MYISTSERLAWRRCRWLWHESYVERLKPNVSAPALRFGSLIHKALELYYIPGVKRGADPVETFQKAYEEELKEAVKMGFYDEDDEWSEAGHLGVSMLENYLATYGKDEQFKVICSEQRFEEPIVNDHGEIIAVYVGVLDGVWQNRSTGRLRMVDHKTAKAIKTDYLALDDQSGAYWTFGTRFLKRHKILKPGDELEFIWFNFLRKAALDTRPRNASGQYLNQNGTVSQKQPAPYFLRHPSMRDRADMVNQELRVKQELSEMWRARTNTVKTYKNPGMFTCPGCPVKSYCELHETGADWQEFRSMMFTPRGKWEPIEAFDWEKEH